MKETKCLKTYEPYNVHNSFVLKPMKIKKKDKPKYILKQRILSKKQKGFKNIK